MQTVIVYVSLHLNTHFWLILINNIFVISFLMLNEITSSPISFKHDKLERQVILVNLFLCYEKFQKAILFGGHCMMIISFG